MTIRINDCKECKYSQFINEEKIVGDDHKGLYAITENKEKVVNELKCYCSFVPKRMRLIKNLGVKYFELEYRLSLRMEKEINEDYDKFMRAENELYDEYIERQKINIPEWCLFEKHKEMKKHLKIKRVRGKQ